MRAQVCVLVSKLLTERSEEVDANVNLLDAAEAMRDARTLPALFMRDDCGLVAACVDAAWRWRQYTADTLL